MPDILLRDIIKYSLIVISLAIIVSVLSFSHTEKNALLRDSTQIYLMSKALLSGNDPYTPISVMRDEEFHDSQTLQDHPSPYPLLLPIFTIPLSFLSLPYYSHLWTFISLALLYFSVLELLKLFSKDTLSIKYSLLIVLLIVPTLPMSTGLVFGQVDCLLLYLFVNALRHEQGSNEKKSALFLTLISCIKTLGAPYVISRFFIQRSQKIIFATIGTTLLLTVFSIGWSGLHNYLTSVTKKVLGYYLFFPQNLSFTSFVSKLVYGMKLILDDDRLLPMDHQISVISQITNLSTILPFLFCFTLCFYYRNRQNLMIILFPLCIFCSPILWSFYFLLFVPLFIREIFFSESKFWVVSSVFVFVLTFYIDLNALSFSVLNSSKLLPLVPFEPSLISIIFSMTPVFILMGYSLAVLRRDVRSGT